MSFDFSTLITDRTQDDVANKTKKGSYRADDLNRVNTCLEYLNNKLKEMGYLSVYNPVLVHPQSGENGAGLPDGYVELEYIESTGSQVIDTGIKPNQDTCFELVAKISNTNSGDAHIMSSNTPQYFALRVNSGFTDFAVRYGNEPGIQNVGANNIYEWHTFRREKNIFYLDGDKKVTSDYIAFQNTLNLPLGGLSIPNGYDQLCKGRYKSLKIWQYGNGLSLDLIACKNPSGVSGMYDLISGRFIEASGAGSFVPGPEIESDADVDTEPLDPYTWYESDVPTVSQMEQYLKNVSAIRSVFPMPESVPSVPDSMEAFTGSKANDIEKVLQAMEDIINRMMGSINLGWVLGIADIGLYGGL